MEKTCWVGIWVRNYLQKTTVELSDSKSWANSVATVFETCFALYRMGIRLCILDLPYESFWICCALDLLHASQFCVQESKQSRKSCCVNVSML